MKYVTPFETGLEQHLSYKCSLIMSHRINLGMVTLLDSAPCETHSCKVAICRNLLLYILVLSAVKCFWIIKFGISAACH